MPSLYDRLRYFYPGNDDEEEEEQVEEQQAEPDNTMRWTIVDSDTANTADTFTQAERERLEEMERDAMMEMRELAEAQFIAGGRPRTRRRRMNAFDAGLYTPNFSAFGGKPKTKYGKQKNKLDI